MAVDTSLFTCCIHTRVNLFPAPWWRNGCWFSHLIHQLSSALNSTPACPWRAHLARGKATEAVFLAENKDVHSEQDSEEEGRRP